MRETNNLGGSIAAAGWQPRHVCLLTHCLAVALFSRCPGGLVGFNFSRDAHAQHSESAYWGAVIKQCSSRYARVTSHTCSALVITTRACRGTGVSGSRGARRPATPANLKAHILVWQSTCYAALDSSLQYVSKPGYVPVPQAQAWTRRINSQLLIS